MFTYFDWANLSVDFPDLTKVSNEYLGSLFFDESLDRGIEAQTMPLCVQGNADLFDGVPFPTLMVHEDMQFNDFGEMLTELYDSIYEFCGYASFRTYGTKYPTKITYTGKVFIVECLGRLDEGFPDIVSALEYRRDILTP